jgi:hypothetical protein
MGFFIPLLEDYTDNLSEGQGLREISLIVNIYKAPPLSPIIQRKAGVLNDHLEWSLKSQLDKEFQLCWAKLVWITYVARSGDFWSCQRNSC